MGNVNSLLFLPRNRFCVKEHLRASVTLSHTHLDRTKTVGFKFWKDTNCIPSFPSSVSSLPVRSKGGGRATFTGLQLPQTAISTLPTVLKYHFRFNCCVSNHNGPPNYLCWETKFEVQSNKLTIAAFVYCIHNQQLKCRRAVNMWFLLGP